MPTTHYILVTVQFLKEDDGRWTAECKELGTASFGNSLDEAKESIEEAIELHLNTLEEIGERERFFEAHDIKMHRVRPRSRANRGPLPRR